MVAFRRKLSIFLLLWRESRMEKSWSPSTAKFCSHQRMLPWFAPSLHRQSTDQASGGLPQVPDAEGAQSDAVRRCHISYTGSDGGHERHPQAMSHTRHAWAENRPSSSASQLALWSGETSLHGMPCKRLRVKLDSDPINRRQTAFSGNSEAGLWCYAPFIICSFQCGCDWRPASCHTWWKRWSERFRGRAGFTSFARFSFVRGFLHNPIAVPLSVFFFLHCRARHWIHCRAALPFNKKDAQTAVHSYQRPVM